MVSPRRAKPFRRDARYSSQIMVVGHRTSPEQKAKGGKSAIVPTVRKATLEIPLQLSDDKGVTLIKNTRMSAFSSLSTWAVSRWHLWSLFHGAGRVSTGNIILIISWDRSVAWGGVTVSEKPQVQSGGTASYAKSSLSASLSTLPTDPVNQWASLSGACWNWLTVRSTARSIVPRATG
jgi:hypothetical protein